MSSDLKSHLADLMRAALLSVAPAEADTTHPYRATETGLAR